MCWKLLEVLTDIVSAVIAHLIGTWQICDNEAVQILLELAQGPLNWVVFKLFQLTLTK